MEYKRLNTIVGWMAFIFATTVYFLTLEPTTSLWDCGEYITTAYKLEVGHPPGAPLFMMLGRIFTMFADADGAAFMVNFMSALSSSFSILFLFWTITMIGKRIVLSPSSIFSGPETIDMDAVKKPRSRSLTVGEQWAIIGSGVIGAIAYTFTDSFWFSAVEGEVYAMSSFFTAIVIWAIFKWDHEVAEQEAHPEDADLQAKNANRWLILIFFMTGLSIGVHLLNLLCIPAIAYVIYFRKFKETTPLGFIVTGVIGIVTLGIVQSILIPKTVQIAGFFERYFVNGLGMGFGVGTVFFFVFMIGIIVFALVWSKNNAKPILNTAVWAVSMIFIGYSCFAMIVIRSNADTPLDENDPENLVSLESYLKREQYGDWPILYGPYFTAEMEPREKWDDRNDVHMRLFVVTTKTGKELKGFKTKEEADLYAKTSGGTVVEKYLQTFEGDYGKPTYDPEHSTYFPRMFSPEERHIAGYKSWSGHKGNRKPTMGENLTYFGSYQVDWMYWRYFMWNFAGRQWDEQGNGSARDGNWISGLNFIDKHHIGTQVTESTKERFQVRDSAGIVVRMFGSELEAETYAAEHGGEVEKWDGVITPSFIKENASHNKFYMLPLILGIIGFIFMLMKASKDWWIVMLLFLLTGFAIIIYLNQKPGEPRERDYAYAASFYAFSIYIGMAVLALYQAFKSIEWKELAITVGTMLGLSIIFAVADTTLSLSMLYISIVIGGVMALMIGLRGVLKNELHGAVIALLITVPVPVMMGMAGWDDHDRSDRYTARDLAYNYLFSCEDNSILFTNGDNDTFPLWYLQEVEELKTSVRVCNLSLLNTDWYTEQMTKRAYDSDPLPIKFTEEQYRQNGLRDYLYVLSTNELTMGDAKIQPKWENVLNDKIALNQDLFKPAFKTATGKLYAILSKTGFAAKQPELFNSLPAFDTTKTYYEFRNLVFNLLTQESAENFGLDDNTRQNIQNVMLEFNDAFDYLPADMAMAYLRDDANVENRGDNSIFFLPTKGLTVMVNKENCLKNKIVSEKDADRIEEKIQWKIPRQSIFKADLMILDMVAHFNWERNIFFASSAERSTYLGLDKYFYSEGLVYRLVPFAVTPNRNPNSLGEINEDRMYENLMNVFRWGNMEKEGVLVDYYTRRLTNNYRVQFSVLADAYLEQYELEQQKVEFFKQVLSGEGDSAMVIQTPIGDYKRSDMPNEIKKSEAIMAECKTKINEVLDKAIAVMPHRNVPYDKVFPSYISTYYAIGNEQRGEVLAREMMALFEEELNYYMEIDPEFSAGMIDDMFSAYRGTFSIYQAVSIYGTDAAFTEEISNRFYTITENIQPKLEKIKKYSPASRQRVEGTFGDFWNRIMGPQ
jgi:hypothetical protein